MSSARFLKRATEGEERYLVLADVGIAIALEVCETAGRVRAQIPP